MYMKKVITVLIAVSAVLFFTNDSFAQKSAKKVESITANKYVHPDGSSTITGAVKIHPPQKQDLINSLQQRLADVNASTTLTAVQKQDLIDRIEAKLAGLE